MVFDVFEELPVGGLQVAVEDGDVVIVEAVLGLVRADEDEAEAVEGLVIQLTLDELRGDAAAVLEEAGGRRGQAHVEDDAHGIELAIEYFGEINFSRM